MAETIENVVTVTPAEGSNPFDESTWSTEPPVVEEKKEEVVIEEKVEENKEEVHNPAENEKGEKSPKPTAETEVPLWKELGYESAAEAKAAFEDFKKPKEQAKIELEFANEQSKKLFEYIKEGKQDEVFNFLAQQKKLSEVASMSAVDAIKLHMEMTNPHFKTDDVLDVFEDTYNLPKKPEQRLDEDDDEFEDRMAEHEKKVAKINRKIERDAVTAKAQLASLATELVLPDINSTQGSATTQTEPDQKELDSVKKARETYLQSLETDFSKFDGFSVTAKSEDADLPVAFVVTDQEKVQLKESLKSFDIDDFVTSNWFTQDGKPNIKRMMEDQYLLKNRDKIFAKFANDAAAQAIENHLKEKGQINVTGEPVKRTVKKDDPNKVAEHFFSN
jgi:hypothetical protein